jgi:hypothetical protein
MLLPWIESVKKTKTLLVFNGITNTKWKSIFPLALQSFNKLSIGVKAKEIKDEKMANVVVFTSEGIAKYTFDNQELVANFDGTRFHGYTMLLHRQNVFILEKAAVFLPNEPKIRGGYKDNGDEIIESPNLNQMRVILVHELVHACGLDNAEHDEDGLFQKNLVPNGDKMASLIANKGSKPMPPMYLSSGTKTKILSNWS